MVWPWLRLWQCQDICLILMRCMILAVHKWFDDLPIKIGYILIQRHFSYLKMKKVNTYFRLHFDKYPKVASSNTSRLEAHDDFSDCLWKGYSILMYCDLLAKSWFPIISKSCYNSRLYGNSTFGSFSSTNTILLLLDDAYWIIYII